MNVYKVFYQENAKEIPVRENTKSIFVEAKTIAEVRNYLEKREYNIEYIQELTPNYLEFEKQSEDFVLEKVNG